MLTIALNAKYILLELRICLIRIKRRKKKEKKEKEKKAKN